MRITLISTVFNEAAGIPRWAEALRAQTRVPDEFVIVDGGSTDGTPKVIEQEFAGGTFPQPRILVEECNIARGRNLAIQNSAAEIIVSTDAGSYPDPNWLEEITQPLLEDRAIDAVGGKSVVTAENDFQRFVVRMEGQPGDNDGQYPSSRNIALRRKAWESVGGYPEWLTLAGEDALYNFELHAAGNRFASTNRAVVRWPPRPTPKAYFRLLYRNGFGAAEAQLYRPYFLGRLVVTACPLLLLFSPHRLAHLKYRYRKNAASALGWLAGMILGKRPPPGWKKMDGILLSPEAQRHACR